MSFRILQNTLNLGLVLILAILCAGCTAEPEWDWQIVEISTIPDPSVTPYPNGAAVCLCQHRDGNQSLIAITAFENREVRDDFKKLKPGDHLSINLIPWAERPAKARAMFIANNFGHLYDLQLYFGDQIPN